ncbi:hypothetical protein D3C76_130510 [compost metagenome]
MNVVWRTEWIKPYETPWSILEKFIFANGIERNDLLRSIGINEVQALKGSVIGNKWKDLFNLSGFDNVKLSNILGSNLVHMNNVNISSLTLPFNNFRIPNKNWFNGHLRWCERCIGDGYHSWFHQFTLINKCLIHNTPLLDKCPSCQTQIPFLFSDNRLSSPFICKCGYMLADFTHRRWREWDKNYDTLIHNALEELKVFKSKDLTEQWLFIPKYTDMELFKVKPTTHFHCDRISQMTKENISLREQDKNTRIFMENKSIFRSIEKYLLNNYLIGHRHCINQLTELKKEEGKEFPAICPYAYAYIFWRKSSLSLNYFYRTNHRCDIGDPPRKGFEVPTKLIQEELHTILNESVRQYSNATEIELNYIMNKITARFCLNFFHEWLNLAIEGSRNMTVPGWRQIVRMKDNSFPRIAFKIINLDNHINTIICHELPHKIGRIGLSNLSNSCCPNQSKKIRKKIREMDSYLPLQNAIKLFENPSVENKNLLHYVDNYISRFNFLNF